jgi:hypothetical protein
LKISQKKKKLKGKKLDTGILDVALLYAIHSATIKNILFENNDIANIFRAFNSTHAFIHLKKIVIDPLRSAGQYANYYIII